MKKTILLVLVLVLALGLTAEVTNADFTFGTPTNLGPPVNSSSWDVLPSISADGLALYFTSDRPGGHGGLDIWVTTRPTKDDPWREPVNLGPPVNSSAGDAKPSISADGLELFFESQRSVGAGGHDLWVTTRATTDDDWGNPVNLGPTVNSSAYDCYPSISSDGLSLYFTSKRPGGSGGNDLWATTRRTRDDPWEPPVNLGPTVNSSYSDATPCISADGSTLFFLSERPGGVGGHDIWVTTRPTTSDPWGSPVNIGPPVNSSANERCPSISADGLLLYFSDWGNPRPGGVGSYDIWQASITPIVDFNGDEIVDIEDLIMLIEHWGQDEPSVDIGPMPWGDGVVDEADLEVLMSYWQQEILPVSLLAYWKLDETEGSITYDSAGENDAYLIGDPLWQPAGGIVDGAIQLDGVDDCVISDTVLNPAERSFSVFAWIKGGAPGQVILSQESGVNWLVADAVDGALKTDLRTPAKKGRIPIPAGPPLICPTVVTDGDWHRVGFVRDGSDRILYVDDIEVARDTATNLESASGGLYIGAGSDLEPGAFWSGLIDDVRIYNRAVTP